MHLSALPLVSTRIPLQAGCANPTQQHAFIEFEAEADAIRASEAVFEPQDW